MANSPFQNMAAHHDEHLKLADAGFKFPSLPSIDNSRSFVLFGDSKTSNSHMSVVTPSIISRSEKVVTVTAGTHLMQVGMRVKVANLMPDDFNGIVPVSAVDSSHWYYEKYGTQGTAVIAGSTHPSGGQMDIKRLDSLSANGMWMWLNGLMGGCLDLVANTARGGWQASYILENISTLESEVTAVGRSAGNAYIDAGINDLLNGDSASSVITALTGICQHNLSMGRRVFLATLEPIGASHASYSAALKASIALVNNWIMNVAPGLLNIIPIDIYTPCLAPLTGASKTGVLSSELVHPSVYGCMEFIAPAIKAVIEKYITATSILPKSIGDTYGQSALSENLNDAGPWVTTSGGSVTGTVTPGTGGVCAGFTVAESGAATSVAAQINTNASGYPEQQYDLGGTVAANDTADLTYNFDITRLAAGDKVKLVMMVELSNLDSGTGNIKAFAPYVVCAAGGFNGYLYIGEYTGTNTPWTNVTTGTKTYTYVSEIWTIPEGLTAFNLHVKLTGAGAVTGGNNGTVKVSQIGLIKQ